MLNAEKTSLKSIEMPSPAGGVGRNPRDCTQSPFRTPGKEQAGEGNIPAIIRAYGG